MPTPATTQRTTQHQPKHLRARGAERKAKAELEAALRHRICGHAVDADRGKQERDSGEGGEERGAEAVGALADPDRLAHADGLDGEVGLHTGERAAERLRRGRGRERGANDELHVVEAEGVLGGGDVKRGLGDLGG